ncbi:hypothetical protein M407DRAFT_29040 [Tulasnella calospora MUT 4182]|uniref:Uncharacterized protein n=1 Tax=Tulasnella calospora MUT 4182 TaxID=1051891 RepID=A0A0C3LIW9_9AGAM|nr:hypothetical protein M407DRAFT_29040 [Tulasnella calospora MUT 4182]
MQRFISKLSKPFQGTRFRDLFPPSGPSLVEEDADLGRDADTQQRTSPDAAEETIPRKLSARERLDYLSHLQISFDTVNFTSSTSHRGGGKAKVVQATVRTGAGNQEVVAVKKLNYHKGMKIRKFSNVSTTGHAVHHATLIRFT